MRNCIVCGRVIYRWERYLCSYCRADFPLTYFCSTNGNMAEESFIEHTQIERAYSLFFFTGSYRNIIHLIKYKEHPELGRYFGRLLGRKIAESCNGNYSLLPDKIVPVPLHWLRWMKRGYNQASEIARGIAKGIEITSGRKIEVSNSYIKRVHVTATQTHKTKEDRRLNMIEAFRPKRLRNRHSASRLQISRVIAGRPLDKGKGISKGEGQCHSNINFQTEPKSMHFLVVDDVFTTGATLEAAVHALRTSPTLADCKVSIATLAYVE